MSESDLSHPEKRGWFRRIFGREEDGAPGVLPSAAEELPGGAPVLLEPSLQQVPPPVPEQLPEPGPESA